MSKILPGRTENSIKNYFYSSIRRLKSNPIMDLFRDVFVLRKKTLTYLQSIREEINIEIDRFNRLSQLICDFILTPNN